MSPRPYRMEKRQAARAETRDRILNAARQLLSASSASALTMDAIARRADVSRLTIYYQFKSRAGLLEALYDHLAVRGNMARMADAFHETHPARALDAMVRTFVGFWASDAPAMRRLRAMAALDSEIGRGVYGRDGRRPRIANELLSRTRGAGARLVDVQQAANVVGMLTSFETYDALSRSGHTDEEIVTVLTALVDCAVSRFGKATSRQAQRSNVQKRAMRDRVE